MVVRLLFVLLIALNIAVAAWLLLGHDDVHGRSAADPSVAMLHLLSEDEPGTAATAEPEPTHPSTAAKTPELPGTAMAVVPATSAAVPVPVRSSTSLPVPPPVALTKNMREQGSLRCLSIGPFLTSQDVRGVRSALAAQVVRSRLRLEQAQQSRGWWVYLPAKPNRAQALAVAAKLEAAHIRDYFVVSTGEQPNTISLGVFKEPANARKRRDDVVAVGFPAQVAERTEMQPEYWLDVAVPAHAPFDWQAHVRSPSPGSHPAGCF